MISNGSAMRSDRRRATDFDLEARAAFARVGVHIEDVVWTNLFANRHSTMHAGTIDDDSHYHMQDSVNWWQPPVQSPFGMAMWRADIEIVMED